MSKANGETCGTVSNYIPSKKSSPRSGNGERIPSEHSLMDLFDLSRGTVRKAIKTLVDEGLCSKSMVANLVSEPHIAHPGGDRPFSFAALTAAAGNYV